MLTLGIPALIPTLFTQVVTGNGQNIDFVVPAGRTRGTLYLLHRGQDAYYDEGQQGNASGLGGSMVVVPLVNIIPGEKFSVNFATRNTYFNRSDATYVMIDLYNGSTFGNSGSWADQASSVTRYGGSGRFRKFGEVGGGGAAGSDGNGAVGSDGTGAAAQGARGAGIALKDSTSGVIYQNGAGNSLYGGGGAVTNTYELGKQGFAGVVWK